MSIVTQVRQKLGRGVRVTMDLPQDFAWEDEVIPLDLQLTSHPSQPDTTVELRFHLYDEMPGSRSNSGTENGVDHRWVMPDRIALASGTSLALPVTMPLPFDTAGVAAAAAAIRDGESVGEKLAGSLMLGALHPPTHLPWFRLRVSVKAEGALLAARASGKIRCRNGATRSPMNPFRR